MNVANPNVDANELEKFGKLAARWWGETGGDGRCVEAHRPPSNATAGMPGPVPRTMDGTKRGGTLT